MSKLRCGVVILSIGLVGVANAAFDPESIVYQDGTASTALGGTTHAASAAADNNFTAVQGNLDKVKQGITNLNEDVKANAANIVDVKKQAETATEQATLANAAASSANMAASKANEAASDALKLSTDTNNKLLEYSSQVSEAAIKSENAVQVAGDAKQTADAATKRVDTAVSDIEKYKLDTDTRIEGFEQTTTQTVNKVQGDVNAVKTSVELANSNSQTALSKSESALGFAEQANTTSIRVEAGLAQEIVDRKADVNRGVEESKAYTDSRFKDFTNQMGEVKKFAAAGISAALAASQIPQVSQGSAFSLGLGVGSYSGESALALGISARLGDYTVTKMTVTSDTSNNIGLGGGIAVEW